MTFSIRRYMLIACLLCNVCVGQNSGTSPYWQDRWRGWHFYEDPSTELSANPALPTPNAPIDPAPELAEFSALQKKLEQSRQIAIMRPTLHNVQRYMELEAKVVAQASYFADMAQRIAWMNPELDPTQQGRPVNARAVEIFDQAQRQAHTMRISQLAQDHVLLFFFRSDCPYCHAYAPTIAALQKNYGLQIVPVSLDGQGLPDFPQPRRDNGIARNLRVDRVPALYLAQPYRGTIIALGTGVLSESQLLERLAILTKPVATPLPTLTSSKEP